MKETGQDRTTRNARIVLTRPCRDCVRNTDNCAVGETCVVLSELTERQDRSQWFYALSCELYPHSQSLTFTPSLTSPKTQFASFWEQVKPDTETWRAEYWWVTDLVILHKNNTSTLTAILTSMQKMCVCANPHHYFKLFLMVAIGLPWGCCLCVEVAVSTLLDSFGWYVYTKNNVVKKTWKFLVYEQFHIRTLSKWSAFKLHDK